jgi:hypothetical protein
MENTWSSAWHLSSIIYTYKILDDNIYIIYGYIYPLSKCMNKQQILLCFDILRSTSPGVSLLHILKQLEAPTGEEQQSWAAPAPNLDQKKERRNILDTRLKRSEPKVNKREHHIQQSCHL